MSIKPILNEADCRSTLAEIETLMTAVTGSEEGKRLDALVALVEEWEELHVPFSETTK